MYQALHYLLNSFNKPTATLYCKAVYRHNLSLMIINNFVLDPTGLTSSTTVYLHFCMVIVKGVNHTDSRLTSVYPSAISVASYQRLLR